MKKMPISWHEQHLRYSKAHLAERKVKLQADLAYISRIESDIVFLELQITEAHRLGKDAFDSDRFLKKAKPANAHRMHT